MKVTCNLKIGKKKIYIKIFKIKNFVYFSKEKYALKKILMIITLFKIKKMI